MSCCPISLHERVKLAAEDEKCQDNMYKMLVHEQNKERSKLVEGIMKMVLDYTQHPAVQLVHRNLNGMLSPTIQKVLLVAACAHEPGFLQYFLDQETICSSTISQYAFQTAPELIENYLNGKVRTDEFVTQAVHAYITL